MSDNHRKMYSKKGTGTVPKIKYGNNTSLLNQDESNLVSNNLGRDFNQPNYIRHIRNSGKYQTPHYFGMDQLIDEQNVISNQNGVVVSANGLSSQNADDSRRNSSETIPKCDNVTKYPDKKQIEDKLNQIREYLHITSSLMSNMKNSEDQSADIEKEQLEKTHNDLKDSEAKLIAMLNDIDTYDKNVVEELKNEKALENGFDNLSELARLPKRVLENKVDHANRQLEMLREQENLLSTLQIKAENQLRDARHAQQRLTNQNTNVDKQPFIDDISDQNSNEVNEILSNNGGKNANQEMIKELEDRLSCLKADSSVARQPAFNIQEQFQAQVESMQQKINQLRDSNDNRHQLIQFLDKRDVQLHSEHMELQGKLWELQNKKMQVDQLVSQLQSMNEEPEEDDIGFQVKKIVSMKEQLSKLKDMLETVKNSENMLESQNMNESDSETPDLTNTLVTKSDNLIQNDVRSNQFNHENVTNTRLENNPTRSSNEQKVKEKQVNKKSMNANEKERLKLQAELQAKKRELEELMCKHKAASSNLNQDVPCENKSDIGATNHSLYEGTTNSWYPMPSNLYHLPNSSERYSSDECAEDDINEYSELNSSGEASNVQMIQPMASLNYPTSNYIKHKSTEPCLEVPESYTRTSSHTPDNSVHTTTGNSPRTQRDRVRSNSERDTQNKTQVQKQLELIRSVCDSILEQQNLGKEQTPVPQNVRNNLTPSPLYSEPRQYASPNPHSMNALNVVGHPGPDSTWVPPNQNQVNVAFNDPTGYHNWLTTNTLQTQAFMLNTLNQCCQMLWLQQRELASLRSTVAMMQEKMQTPPFDQNNSMSMYMNSNSCMYPLTMPTSDSRESSQMRTGLANSKMNQVSSAASLPNLNHPHVAHATNTIDSAYANQNNLHNARILESGLNNTIHQNSVSGHVNNSLLQGVNQTLPSQIWNGQALNNQVAPGNRANNYWDNFRSYSRQNLLSTKSNEGLQNQSTSSERPNNSSERSQPYTFPSLSTQKRNPTHQESSSSSVENTPRRKTLFKSPRHSLNTDTITTIPPDVLNINEAQTSQKLNENNDLMEIPLQIGGFEPFVNTFEHAETSTNNSNVSDTQENKNYTPTSQRNRNEWNNEANNDNVQSKSKLFDELRENVYREVACLISANQGRPHFLIQLFRDLQMVSSDPMRRKTLQSIQSLISHSLLGTTQSIFRQSTNTPASSMENDILTHYPSYFPANYWSQQRSNIESDSSLDADCPDYLSEVLTFLNTHSEDTLQQNLLESLKELLVECTFNTVFSNNNTKDSIIQKHFANLTADAFEQYKGKRVQDVRMNILQTIEDLLRGEISLIRLMRENISDANDLNCLIANDGAVSQPTQNIPFDLSSQLPNSSSIGEDCNNPPQMQNGDLAEADQSRVELDDEEEGAVGGVLNIIDECNTNGNVGQTDIEYTEQGLDQVPTRLTTHSRSQLNTPIRDRSNSSRTDTTEQF